jgi:DNA-directed RNA polymerase subunit H (RpoH/RPB5)
MNSSASSSSSVFPTPVSSKSSDDDDLHNNDKNNHNNDNANNTQKKRISYDFGSETASSQLPNLAPHEESLCSHASVLSRVWVNVTRMLHRRGYITPTPKNVPVSSIEDITGKSTSKWMDLTFTAHRSYDTDPKTCGHVLVVFWNGPFGIDALRPFVDEILWNAYYHEVQLDMFLVVHCMETTKHPSVSYDVKQMLMRTSSSSSVPLQVFPDSFFYLDKAEHELAPYYTNVTDDFDEDVMQCKKHELPKLSVHDPMAIYYNLQPGMIVRVQFPDQHIHTYVIKMICFCICFFERIFGRWRKVR